MLKFDMSDKYKGAGFSGGLHRGLMVYYDDNLLLEEGMGLGACAYQTEGYTYFASIKNIKRVENSFEVIYGIDMKLELKVFGIKSQQLTRFQECAISNIYMRYDKMQRGLLGSGAFFRKLFNIETCFAKVPPLGEVKINYELGNEEVMVNLGFETENTGGRLYVMNELGGSIFDKGISNGKLSAAPSGWQKTGGFCELYSSLYAMSFAMVEKDVPDNIKSNLYWGSERSGKNCCWAGFESEITCETGKFVDYIYSIKFREVEQ